MGLKTRLVISAVWYSIVIYILIQIASSKKLNMGKKDNSKAKERKAERKAMEKKMNAGVANVKLANSVEDPLGNLPKPFSVFNKNGLDLTLETMRLSLGGRRRRKRLK